MKATERWLRLNGATRPMSAAGVVHLVLGEWTQSPGKETGTYPVSYFRNNGSEEERWFIHGEPLDSAPSTKRIRKALNP